MINVINVINVIKRLKLAVILILLILTALLLGCTKSGNSRSSGTACSVYLENLPKEYNMLSKEIRDHIEISLTLRNVSSNKKYRLKLTDKNTFLQTLDLVPGTYDVSSLYLYDTELAMFEINTKSKSIKIEKGNQFKLPITITNPADFINTMKKNQPSKEILAENIYSRKVQWNGQIIDLYNIRKIMKFVPNDKILDPSEICYIQAANNTGVIMVVQNQTSKVISADKATFVGVRFFKNNVVLPKGITIGMNMSAISHAKKGILGTPDYFKGTPLIGMGFDRTTFVYVDKASGDRISFEMNPDDTFVGYITYEFAKYE